MSCLDRFPMPTEYPNASDRTLEMIALAEEIAAKLSKLADLSAEHDDMDPDEVGILCEATGVVKGISELKHDLRVVSVPARPRWEKNQNQYQWHLEGYVGLVENLGEGYRPFYRTGDVWHWVRGEDGQQARCEKLNEAMCMVEVALKECGA